MTEYYGFEEGEEYKPWLWPVPDGNHIGKRGLRRVDGFEKVSGTGEYTRDVKRSGMLYAKQLCSPYAHAKIKSMDTSKAENYPGVRAVVKWDDPELNWIDWHSGLNGLAAEHVNDEAHFYGQPVGAIVCGESEAIVDEALKLIDIEWEELPFYTDWDKAIEPGANPVRPDIKPDGNIIAQIVTEYGDVEQGFQEADHIIEFTQKQWTNVWAGVEPHSGVAEYKDGHMEVWARSQQTVAIATELGQVYPRSKVQVHTPYLGACFGGIQWQGLCRSFPHLPCFLAKKTKKPVKMLFDGSHFYGTGERPGTWYFKVGFKDNGEITAVDIVSIRSTGDIGKLREATKIPNFHLTMTPVFMNEGNNNCYKHGASASTGFHNVMAHVAAELEMDPTEVALINDGCEGHDMAWINENVKEVEGFNPDWNSLEECLKVGKAAIDWDNKWHQPGTRLLPNGKYHGIGFIWNLGWSNGASPGECAVGIRVQFDGTVNIVAQHGDGGWGSQTAYIAVVADEMGMKFEDVSWRHFNEAQGFATYPGAGSTGLSNTLPSIVRASIKAKKLMLEVATDTTNKHVAFGKTSAFPDKTPDELDMKDSVVFEKANPANKKTLKEVIAPCMGYIFWYGHMAPHQFFVWDWPSRITEKKHYMGRQVYFVEVEVDPDTGVVEVTNITTVYDTGKCISPETCEGQMYGGLYLGMGASYTEEVIYDPQTGVKLSDNLINYACALMGSCGPIDVHLIEGGLGYGAYGAYGIGESGGANGKTLGNVAVYNAIGKWVDLPATPDRILKALGKA